MKRGTPEHPKTEMLAMLLGVPLAQAVGHLEMFWHFVGRYAPRGDVGRWTDAIIAKRSGWERDPEIFIESLLKADACGNSGWLERNEQFRLVVHDWDQHADDSVRKTLESHNWTFWNGSPARGKASPAARESVANHSRTVRESVASDSPPAEPSRARAEPEPSRADEPDTARLGSGTARPEQIVGVGFEDAVRTRAKAVQQKMPPMRTKADRDFLWKVCALVERGFMSEDDLADSVEAVRQKEGIQKPWGYFSACLSRRVGEDELRVAVAREKPPPPKAGSQESAAMAGRAR